MLLQVWWCLPVPTPKSVRADRARPACVVWHRAKLRAFAPPGKGPSPPFSTETLLDPFFIALGLTLSDAYNGRPARSNRARRKGLRIVMKLSTTTDGDERLHLVTDGDETVGFVAVDSTVGGRAFGGLRLLPDIDAAEMRGLARAMTLKYGFLGLPHGGAKAGVRGDPEAPQAERRARLVAFGRAIAPVLLSREYSPGADMGTDNADIRHMLAEVGVPASRRELRTTRSGSGYFTAYTVFVAAREAARRTRGELAGATVAIEGFGKVGAALAGLFDAAGARVIAVSTTHGAIHGEGGLDVKRLLAAEAERGSRFVQGLPEAEPIEKTTLLELPVDILAPCARHDSVHAGNVARIAARIVCPGANNPVTPEAESVLFDRGVLSVPDFVANCGGVLGAAMSYFAISPERIEAFMSGHFGARIGWILDHAAREGVLPRAVAVPLSRRRFAEIQAAAAHATPAGRLRGAALGLYRHGLVPGSLMAARALPHFAQTMA